MGVWEQLSCLPGCGSALHSTLHHVCQALMVASQAPSSSHNLHLSPHSPNLQHTSAAAAPTQGAEDKLLWEHSLDAQPASDLIKAVIKSTPSVPEHMVPIHWWPTAVPPDYHKWPCTTKAPSLILHLLRLTSKSPFMLLLRWFYVPLSFELRDGQSLCCQFNVLPNCIPCQPKQKRPECMDA